MKLARMGRGREKQRQTKRDEERHEERKKQTEQIPNET
jgi:hypothetical protein